MASLPDSSINLSELPAPTIFEELDYQTVLKERLNQFNGLIPLFFDEDGQPVSNLIEADVIETSDGLFFQIPVNSDAGLYYTELNSDPLVRALQIDTYLELLENNKKNVLAQSLMPAFVSGAELDHLAAIDNITRKTIQTENNTVEPAIPAVLESDAAFRMRWLLSRNAHAIGGPESWYLYQALSADDRVKNAKILSPNPMEIKIIILSHEGNGEATQELLDAVDDYIRNHSHFPQSDLLTIVSAEIIEYSITATVVYYVGASEEIVNLEINAGYDAFKTQREKIGESVYSSPIASFLQTDGVYRATIDEPSALPVTIDAETQAPYCTGLTIVNGGQHGTL